MAFEFFRYGELSYDIRSDGGARYLPWCTMAYGMMDIQNGFFIKSLQGDGYLSEPAISLQILNIIRGEYQQFLIEKQAET